MPAAKFAQQEQAILIVDDDEDFRDEICRSLEKRGLTAISAGGGNAAFALLEARTAEFGAPRVQVVVSDWAMPEGGGIELLDLLRKGAYRDVPFILMSGSVEKEKLVEAFRHDLDGLLLKPFPIEDLLSKVQDAILQRHRKILVRDSKKAS